MELYEIPLLLIAIPNGSEEVPMEESSPMILEAMGFNFFTPANAEAAYDDIRLSWELSEEEGKPVGILLEIREW